MRERLDRDLAHVDDRAWAKARRNRTRDLIQLGGLVRKAQLDAATNNDKALLFGALLEIRDRLTEDKTGRLHAELTARGRASF